MNRITNFNEAVTPLNRTNFLPDWVLEDFRGSGVPDALTEANVFYAEDLEALNELGLSKWSLKSQTETTRAKAQAIARGIWFTYGTTLDGGEGPAIYAKPRYPRQAVGFGAQSKPVKYETRYGDRATPILPWADSATAAAVFERQQIEPLPGETFWQTVQRSNCPIAITEGLKKALKLLAHGVPAIALRGVTCWNLPQSQQLHEAIAQFATPNRQWAIVFDQDSKPRTVRAVGNEIRKLGTALERTGGQVSVWVWPQEQGKGIDDVMVAQSNPDRWLDSVIGAAPTLSTWKRDRFKAVLMAELEQHSIMPIAPERISRGRYLPNLPAVEPGTIYALDAPMGTGKTERIGADWVREVIARNWNVLVLSPANSLGQQTAQRWKLPHIHDYDLTNVVQSRLLQAHISHGHGLVLCPDSLLRVPDWFWNGNRPLLIVFDEANQTAQHIVEGGTLGLRQSAILDRLGAMMERAGRDGAIVLSEADLLPRTINWAADLSKCQKVRFFQHRAEIQPWQVEMLGGSPIRYVTALRKSLEQGDRIFLVTSSQFAGKRIELLAQQWGKRVLRIDSETNEGGQFTSFWQDPNQYLGKHGIPDLLILSPSGKSGVSINISGFDSVWGYFTCLSPSTWLQQLGRYRLPVPRKIFAKPFIPSSGDESLLWESKIQERLAKTRTGLPRLLGLEVSDLMEAVDAGSDATRILAIQEACERFYLESAACIGMEKSMARDLLIDRLRRQGHYVQLVELEPSSTEMSQAWQQTKDSIWLENAQELAAIKIEPHHTPDWARKILNSTESSRALRQIALKVLAQGEFPGVSFDDVTECEAVFKGFGAMRRSIALQVRAENLDWSRIEDSELVKQQFSQAITLTHRFPKTHLKALLIKSTGILTLLDGRPYSNTDPRVQEIREKSLFFAEEIKYYLGINVLPRQTPCEIANKLLRRLGLVAVRIAYATVRKGDRKGQRDWIYVLPQLWDETRIKLLRAATIRLTGSEATIQTEPPQEYVELINLLEARQRKPNSLFKKALDRLDCHRVSFIEISV